MGPLAVVARFRDAASADALVTFLAAHEIRAHLEGADPLSIGLGGRVRVVIAEEEVRRARWLIENADASVLGEAEAWLDAAGEREAGAATRPFAKSAGANRQKRKSALRTGAIALAVLLAIAALLSR